MCDFDNNNDETDNIGELEGHLSPEALAALTEHLRSRDSTHQKDEKEVTKYQEKNATLPTNNASYKNKDYWDERFETEDNFEWLLSYEHVKYFILPKLKVTDRILIVGCGNSSFSEQLYDEGYFHIVNIDYSPVVIQKMLKKNEIKSQMKFIEMDMLNLQFENDHFDVVIDKATMDALLVDEGDVWSPKESVVQQVDIMCQNISRVLKRDGFFIQISFAQHHFRSKYLMGERISGGSSNLFSKSEGRCERYKWDLECFNIVSSVGCFDYFYYIMQKYE